MEIWALQVLEETRVTLAPTAQLVPLAREAVKGIEEILAPTAQRVQLGHSVGAVKLATPVHTETQA